MTDPTYVINPLYMIFDLLGNIGGLMFLILMGVNIFSVVKHMTKKGKPTGTRGF